MKRVFFAVVCAVGAAVAARPVAGQLAGMPVWNSPGGGTGITISGDYGKPNTDAGSGDAFGARAALGLGSLTLSAGLSTYKPELFNDRAASVGGGAAFRLIGGTLLPIAVNLQAGAASTAEITSGAATVPRTTTVTGAVGVSVSLPTPGISIEPYVSPGLRYRKPSGGSSDTNFGFVVGANLSFGLLGAHIAYDSESAGGGQTRGIIGLGAHLALKVPLGM
jgi:hypothetical protein